MDNILKFEPREVLNNENPEGRIAYALWRNDPFQIALDLGEVIHKYGLEKLRPLEKWEMNLAVKRGVVNWDAIDELDLAYKINAAYKTFGALRVNSMNDLTNEQYSNLDYGIENNLFTQEEIEDEEDNFKSLGLLKKIVGNGLGGLHPYERKEMMNYVSNEVISFSDCRKAMGKYEKYCS